MRWLRATPLLLLAVIFSCRPASAEPFASDPSVGRLSSARLLAGNEESGGVRLAALEIDLAPKAVTYWRTPGEAGVAPTLDFSASENLASVETLFPVPRHIKEAGGVVAGYETKALFPLRMRPRDPKIPVKLDLNIDYAACDKICLPVRAHLNLLLSPGATSPHAAEIARVLAENVPKRLDPTEALRMVALRREGEGEVGGWRLDYRGKGALLDVFCEVADPWTLESTRSGEGFALTLYSASGARAAPKDPVAATLTLVTDHGAWEAPIVLQ
jgi:DsbC/DsbD-like thiol-disulfide interchange protein